MIRDVPRLHIVWEAGMERPELKKAVRWLGVILVILLVISFAREAVRIITHGHSQYKLYSEGTNQSISLEEISERTSIVFPDNACLINSNLHQRLHYEIKARMVFSNRDVEAFIKNSQGFRNYKLSRSERAFVNATGDATEFEWWTPDSVNKHVSLSFEPSGNAPRGNFLISEDTSGYNIVYMFWTSTGGL